MIIESKAQILVPTVQYGNLMLSATITLNSATDMARIEEELKSSGESFKHGSIKTEQIQSLANRLVKSQIEDLKSELDSLTKETFELAK